ncbi:MAG: hypothetical protein M9904_18630 [Chitinophagaceae bacterium]|nr:hypothetical protein [Chitinophagaceae bacterium]
MRKIVHLISCFVEAMIRNIGGSAGRRIRYWYYHKKLGSCGKKVYIDINVTFLNPHSIFLGEKVWIDNGAILMAGKPANGRKTDIRVNEHYQFERGELHVGNEVHIGPQVIIQAHGGCEIGDKLTIGAGSKLYTLSHHYRNTIDKADTTKYYFGSMTPNEEQFLIEAPVVVKSKSAVGMNCTILPGSTIPEGAWLGVGLTIKRNSLKPDTVYTNMDEVIKG